MEMIEDALDVVGRKSHPRTRASGVDADVNDGQNTLPQAAMLDPAFDALL